MALKTRLTEMLNIKHPIMLAGMGGVSYAEVCAAMCNAGGYGVLGMAGTTPDFIAGQMKRVRELTDRPFGVDLLAASPERDRPPPEPGFLWFWVDVDENRSDLHENRCKKK